MAKIQQKEGRRYRFRDQEFYAYNGRIAIENQVTGEYKTISRVEFVARAVGFNEVLKRDALLYPDERAEMARLVTSMCECNREARAQGDPDAPGVMKQVARDNRVIQAGIDDKPVHLPKIMPGKKIFSGGVDLHSETYKKLSI